MASLNLSLPDEMRSFIDQSAKAGAYAGPSEFVRALIRREMEKSDTLSLAASVQRGISDVEQGRYAPFDADAIRSRVQNRRAGKGE